MILLHFVQISESGKYRISIYTYIYIYIIYIEDKLNINSSFTKPSEAFKDILDGKEPSSSPRDHLVLDIDPVYNQAGIVQGDFKLLVGNPAPYKFDEVYPLISVSYLQPVSYIRCEVISDVRGGERRG